MCKPGHCCSQMAVRSLGNQFIAGDPSLNPAGSYETVILRVTRNDGYIMRINNHGI